MSLRWTEEEYQRVINQRDGLDDIAAANGLQVASKYRNKRTTVDGITFDSKKEANRYCQLRMLEQSGTIQELQLQVVYELAPSYKLPSGSKKKALTYRADFTYIQAGKKIVEDVKGMLTDVYRIKKHLMFTCHQIHIQEV